MMVQRKQTLIDGETAIKPFFYMRNGLLHARFTVDRAIELSETEVNSIKNELAKAPYNKQAILRDNWSFFEKTVGKTVIHDGIKEVGRRIEEAKNGLKNRI